MFTGDKTIISRGSILPSIVLQLKLLEYNIAFMSDLIAKI